MKKNLTSLSILFLAGLFALEGCSGFSLNNLVKSAIEKFGPKMTKTSLTVQKVDLSPGSGSGSIEGLVIGNPEGFKTPSSISAGKIEISIEPKSVLGDVIVIHHLALIAPEITYETTFSESNLTRIQKNMLGDGKSESSSSKKLILEHVQIKSGKIRLSHEIAGGQSVASPLPDLDLRDIGKSAGGISPENAFGEILKAVIAATVKSANPVEKAGDALKGLFQ